MNRVETQDTVFNTVTWTLMTYEEYLELQRAVNN